MENEGTSQNVKTVKNLLSMIVEFQGSKMICLCSKMYCVEDKAMDTTKLSCKGVNKK